LRRLPIFFLAVLATLAPVPGQTMLPLAAAADAHHEVRLTLADGHFDLLVGHSGQGGARRHGGLAGHEHAAHDDHVVHLCADHAALRGSPESGIMTGPAPFGSCDVRLALSAASAEPGRHPPSRPPAGTTVLRL
jgi:hypothetical protein